MTARPARWSPRALLLARFGASLALSLLAVGNALVAAAALTGGGRAAGPLTPAAVVAGVGLAALAALQYAASRILRRRPGSAVVRAAIVATAAAVAGQTPGPAR